MTPPREPDARKSRPHLCPCARTCTPIYNGLAGDSRIVTGDLNEGYSGDCIGRSVPLEYTVGGNQHVNDLNHCIFTPLKGVLRFQICQGDVEAMVDMGRAVMAELKPEKCVECGSSPRTSHFVVLGAKLYCCRCAAKSGRWPE